MKSKSITIECWDNGDKTVDRYTIAISGLMTVEDEPYTMLLGASSRPYHPQGFAQHCGEMPAREWKRGSKKHLGKRIMFTDLPADVQKWVASHFMPEE
jgi:hypothetical protein